MRFEFGSDSDKTGWLFSLNSIQVDQTAVSNERSGMLPEGFSLSQNYPNPFNPTTTIRYSIKDASLVNLSVFNMLGQEVAQLVNKQQSAGNYEAYFDASGLSSGVYIYKIEAGSFQQTRKMLFFENGNNEKRLFVAFL